jgi:hypothetical protein
MVEGSCAGRRRMNIALRNIATGLWDIYKNKGC